MKIYPEFLGRASASPGVCWICRRSKNSTDVVVDPQRSIDMEGSVQFCATCVTEMGHMVGMHSPEDQLTIESVRKQLQEAIHRADLAEEALDKLGAVYDARAARRKVQEKRDAEYD